MRAVRPSDDRNSAFMIADTAMNSTAVRAMMTVTNGLMELSGCGLRNPEWRIMHQA